MASYDRYRKFRIDGEIKIVPFCKIPKKNTDFYETRLDLLSYDYYGNGDYAWLIMQANPEYGSMEFEIPDGVMLRIPYPLDDAISSYEQGINRYNDLY